MKKSTAGRTGGRGKTPGKKVTNGLVALSSAAVLTVYSAGYLKTRAAAERFAVSTASRRPAPTPSVAPDTPKAARAAAAASPARPAPLPPAASSPGEAKAPLRAPSNVAIAEPPAAAPTPSTVAVEVPKATPAAKSAAPSASAPAAATPTTASPAAAASTPTYDPSEEPYIPRGPYRDGTYLGWGYSRHGDIQASVGIENGHIVSAVIAQCLTRYSCDVIERLPPQVVKRQSPDVDYVSGATQSADAFYGAVVEALAKAK